MRITSVSYERLQSFGEYENEAVGVTVEVGERDNVDDVMEIARRYVDEQLKQRRTTASAALTLREATYHLDRVNADIAAAERKWERVKAFMERIGVDAGSRFDDVPF